MTGRVVHVPTAASGFADDRRWVSLQDVCLGVFDCPHSTPVIAADGPYVVRSQDIRTGRLDLATTARVSEATYQERIERAEPRTGDLLYSREGTYFGIAAEVPPDVRVCLGQRMVLIRPNPELIVSRYLLYWLNSPIMAAQVSAFRDGSVAERLNMPTIRGLPVPLADRETQRRIADVLGALDDKIALNARMNATLEAMARAVFEDWFVRFGPVRAKAEGRARPGLAPDLAALFPDRVTETLDGEVPEGWRQSNIGQEADCVGGSTPSTDAPHLWHPADHAWATPKDLAQRPEPFLLATDRKISDAGLAGISSGLLPVGSVLLSSRAPIGYRAITAIPVAINQGFIGLRCWRSAGPEFIYLWLGANMDSIHARANGSTFMEISKASFRPIPLIVPPEPIMVGFTALVRPMFERIRANQEETRTLTALRDLLLPRLISGQLRLRDAERVVEAAL